VKKALEERQRSGSLRSVAAAISREIRPHETSPCDEARQNAVSFI